MSLSWAWCAWTLLPQSQWACVSTSTADVLAPLASILHACNRWRVVCALTVVFDFGDVCTGRILEKMRCVSVTWRPLWVPCCPWTKGESILREARIPSVAAAVDRSLPVLPTYRAPLRLRPSGCDSASKMGLHAAQSAPGSICDCGRMNALRGDRVQRGPAWKSGVRDGGAGNFGTVVRCDEQQGLRTAKWDDRTEAEPLDHARPFNPSDHEVVHPPFRELGRPRPQGRSRQTWEREPQHFDDVTVFPDVVEVQKLFDGRPACGCAQPRCRGALQWSARAGRHAGRSGYIVQKDAAGRCHCSFVLSTRRCGTCARSGQWSGQPTFLCVNATVECRLVDRWFLGTVMHLRWREKGWGDRRTPLYIVLE